LQGSGKVSQNKMSSSYKHPRTEVAFEHDVDRAIKLLRVSKGVTKQEIEKSFRKLALTLHPDKTSDRKANERFPKAFNAKELLLNNLDFLAKLARVDRARKFLRVSKDATKEEIENSFRQLAKTLHPDKTSDLKAHERLLEAINAKELLLHHFEKEFGKLSKIFEERFEKLHEWLQRNEDDSKLLKTAITYQRRRRQTNLHFILERNPPIGIIQKLIKYAPEALQMSDVSGRLPIHTACGRSNSCDVIQTLVK
jgi:DnaJ-domain-containing protein 1